MAQRAQAYALVVKHAVTQTFPSAIQALVAQVKKSHPGIVWYGANRRWPAGPLVMPFALAGHALCIGRKRCVHTLALKGATPAARQSRLRGVPGRGCASRTAGFPHSSHLTAHKGTARRAPTDHPPSSHRATTRVAPTPSLLRPHSSLLRPHPSPLTPTTSLLTPHSSLLRPPSSPLSRTRSSPSI